MTAQDSAWRGARSTGVTASLRRARVPLITGGGVLAAAAVIAARSPYTAGSYGFCPIRAVTGMWCPGCGGLRAVHDLMNLDVVAAWGMNALLVLAVPFLVGLWVRWTWRALRDRPVAQVTVRQASILAAVLLGFAVLRNLPGLEVLAP